MKQFDAELELDYTNVYRDVMLSTTLNGGTLNIYVENGVNWTLSETIAADYAGPMFVAGARMKFSPTGGATFSIDTRGAK